MALIFIDGSQPSDPKNNATTYTYTIQCKECIILEYFHPIGKAIVFEAKLAAISIGIR